MSYIKIKNDLLNLDIMSCTKNCQINNIIKEENIQCRLPNFKNLMFSKKLVENSKL